MKTLFVALVALLFAFFLGCQSSITDPEVLEPTKFVGTSEDNSIDKDWLTVHYPNAIKLEGKLFDPSHPPLNFAAISGSIKYGIDRNLIDQRPPFAGIKVKLYVNAELKSGCPKQDQPWTVSSRSEDVVDQINTFQSTFNLTKSFKVYHTCCAPLNLVLKFRVTEKEVTLVSMSLRRVNKYLQTEELKID